jgi:hypothetical protein
LQIYPQGSGGPARRRSQTYARLDYQQSLFVWLVVLAGGWCRFVLREKYCWLIAGG